MNTYSEIKHISLEDFKNIDINRILYVQLDSGEILMIDNNYNNNQNLINFENKKQKENNFKKDYSLPKEFFEGNININKPRSVEKINKKYNLIKGFKSLKDTSIEIKLAIYDKIPKRAKYWENESFDSSRSHFQVKRLKKQSKYNNHNYDYINNYKPIQEENEKIEEFHNYNNNYNYNNMYYNNQINQYMDTNYLYQLALGPLYTLYKQDQQAQNFKNNKYGQYSQNDIYFNNQNYYNYYQEQINPIYYNNFHMNLNENQHEKKIKLNKK